MEVKKPVLLPVFVAVLTWWSVGIMFIVGHHAIIGGSPKGWVDWGLEFLTFLAAWAALVWVRHGYVKVEKS